MAGVAIRLHRIGQRIEIAHDRQHPRGIEHVGAIAETSVHRVLVVGAGQRIGIGDLRGRRHRRIAVAVAPEDVVAGAEKDVLNAGAALGRLVIVVADRVFVGQLLEERRVLVLHVVERHRGAAALVRRRAGIGGHHKGVEIVEAAGRIVFGGVADAAVRLLPHLIEPMGGIPGVGIVGEVGTGQLKRPVRQRGIVGDARIGRPARDGRTGRTGGEQEEIARFQGRLDYRQLRIGETA